MTSKKLDITVDLSFDNRTLDDSKMRVFYDCTDTDLVGFVFSFKGKPIYLNDSEEVTGDGEEYFHLSKNQVGFLIDFLKRIEEGMEYDK